MARFDVYENPEGPGAFLDVQSDLFDDYNTRVVVPLMPRDVAPVQARFLNPEFTISDETLIMVTQYIGAVPRSILSRKIGNITAQSDQITRATDMLFQGF